MKQYFECTTSVVVINYVTTHIKKEEGYEFSNSVKSQYFVSVRLCFCTDSSDNFCVHSLDYY